MAMAPTQDAMTMMTVSAALGMEDDAPDTVVAPSAPLVALASEVTVCVTRLTDLDEVWGVVLSSVLLLFVLSLVGVGVGATSEFVDWAEALVCADELDDDDEED